MHEESIDFIEGELSLCGGQNKVVVTHPVLTLLNYLERFVGSILIEAFAVELTGMIEKYQPAY